ncbi:MAG: hypothetical protein ABIO36_10580 [Pyrinomonadaceae bacterium]
MIKRNQSKAEATRARQQNDSKRWRTYALMAVCGLLLVSGFFFAGREHFSSMDYGMKNSRLRKQVDELQAEKRRLLLAREVSLSPNEIKKAAKRTGMNDTATAEVEVAQAVPVTKEKATSQPASEVKSMIVKTAAVIAVAPTRVATAVYSKPEKMEKPVKKTLSTE